MPDDSVRRIRWVEEYLKDATAFGARRVLQKPVTPNQLLAVVAEVLSPPDNQHMDLPD